MTGRHDFRGRDSGFATPAATLLSLTIAIAATAVIAASSAQARLARADLEKAQAESLLAGAQQRAALTTLASGAAGRLQWDLAIGRGFVAVLAEPEVAKASLAAAAKQKNEAFNALGVQDPTKLKAALVALDRIEAARGGVAALDASTLWRECANSLISPFGLRETFALTPTAAPGAVAPVARIGEVWRIRVSQPGGWTDDRLVRFTGDLLHPAAVLVRRFTRTAPGRGQCDVAFNPA